METSIPGVIPQDWVHDYDYQAPLSGYLQSQYVMAKNNGEQAYVYLFSDESHCRETRRFIEMSAALSQSFDGIRVVMLDEQKMPWPRSDRGFFGMSKGIWLPAVIAITPDGRLDTGRSIFPDIYFFHRYLVTGKPRHTLQVQPMPNEKIALLIRQEFDKHAQDETADDMTVRQGQ